MSIFSKFFGKDNRLMSEAQLVSSPLSGTIVPLEGVADQTFADKILGDGLAVEPAEGKLYSPVDGTISTLMDTGHALCMVSDGGAELLIHVGQDTVKLGGKHFSHRLVKEGDRVRRGDLLLEFDLAAIAAEGYPLTTPIILLNGDGFTMTKAPIGTIGHGDTLFTLKKN